MSGNKSPVLLLFFNRDETIIQVIDKIRAYAPNELFLACDGPRTNKDGETDIVQAIRKLVLDNIDWSCNVYTKFNEHNLGCGKAVSNAITWFFEHVNQGIILEDDCLPLDGFFDFCNQMLNYYKDEPTVYQIAGTNLQGGIVRGPYSYYFSKFTECWGWATWARAWKNFDYNMTGLEKFKKEGQIKRAFKSKDEQNYWIKTFDRTLALDTWDYQWLLTMLSNDGTCVVPNRNLILNIGFDGSGTHTLNAPKWYKKLTSGFYDIFPIKHPENTQVNFEADEFRYYQTFHIPFLTKVYRYVKLKIS